MSVTQHFHLFHYTVKPLIVIQTIVTRACLYIMNTYIHMHAHGNICSKVHENQLFGCQQLPFLNPLSHASGVSWFGRWPEQHEPAHQCACSYTLHLILFPGNHAWSHPHYSSGKPPVRLCFPKIVFSASVPHFISVSHWLLCVIFDTLL